MTRIIILKSAELDFKELCSDFKAHHGAPAYAQFKAAFKTLLADLKQFPDSGAPIDEALQVGLLMRQRLCEQVRVIYHHDKTEGTVYIRMLLPTQRNFLEHLTTRILRPIF
ncbi:type II toxin-antitoxin system RelE/ParE family toxin [Janthinobacterium sp. RB2R34]|uniref:type II toxin-antitoxin system RelE/ParE family toxin n=1 Tax=Janthinobacterium sp. RB2R34 TaxID=3424193 RepID=UPI003F1ECD7E